MSSAILLLGSNLGDRAAYLAAARRAIELDAGAIARLTDELRTEPWGYESSNFYLNQIVVVDTELEPLELLDVLQGIESDLGRTRSQRERYTDRTIDIDILYYDSLIVDSERLTLPHPRIDERDFVIKLLGQL